MIELRFRSFSVERIAAQMDGKLTAATYAFVADVLIAADQVLPLGHIFKLRVFQQPAELTRRKVHENVFEEKPRITIKAREPLVSPKHLRLAGSDLVEDQQVKRAGADGNDAQPLDVPHQVGECKQAVGDGGEPVKKCHSSVSRWHGTWAER